MTKITLTLAGRIKLIEDLYWCITYDEEGKETGREPSGLITREQMLELLYYEDDNETL